ncbi:hypothetical protein REPUB_Repub14bG0024300 [Reevesia pubescens]
MEWFWYMLSNPDQDSCSLFIMRCWSIWSARNEYVYKSARKTLSEVNHRASFLLEEFNKVNFVPTGSKVADLSNSKWQCPSSTNAKINFDDAIFTDLKATGIGVAIRDSAGDVLALLSCKSQGIFDPFIAECLALQRALTFALEIGIYEAEIEGDSPLTITAVKNENIDHSIAEGIIESIKDLLGNFSKFRLKHVKRDGNLVAHTLAKHSRSVDGFQVWMEEAPSFLSALVKCESNVRNDSVVSNTMVYN